MNKFSLFVFVVSLFVVLQVNDAGFLRKIAKPFERLGREIQREVKDVGKAVEHVGKAVGKIGGQILKPVLKPLDGLVVRPVLKVIRPVVKLIQKRRPQEQAEVIEVEGNPANLSVNPESFDVGMVRLHNELRALEGVAGVVSWDARLAELSQAWVAQCSLSYPVYSDSRDLFGQNAFITTNPTAEPINAINTWYSYKSNVDLATGDCVSGQVCTPYLQATMPESTYVGCAQGTCGSFSGGQGGSIIFCMYAPY